MRSSRRSTKNPWVLASLKNTATATAASLARANPRLRAPPRTRRPRKSRSATNRVQSQSRSRRCDDRQVLGQRDHDDRTTHHLHARRSRCPRIVAFNETVIDTLPSSLDFDEYVSAKCTSGCPPEVEPVHTYKPIGRQQRARQHQGRLVPGQSHRHADLRVLMKLIFRASVRSTTATAAPRSKPRTKSKTPRRSSTTRANRAPFEEATIPAAGHLRQDDSARCTRYDGDRAEADARQGSLRERRRLQRDDATRHRWQHDRPTA